MGQSLLEKECFCFLFLDFLFMGRKKLQKILFGS